jgi:hypothetical protein
MLTKKSEIEDFTELIDKIDHGTASNSEYLRFEDALKKNGIKQEDVKSAFTSSGYSNWTEFLNKKQLHTKLTDSDVKLLGVLVGLAMFALYLISSSSNEHNTKSIK